MIYTSIDTIPYKVFWKIKESGNLTLLTDDPKPNEEALREIWEQILIQYGQLPEATEEKKTLDISSRLEELNARLESVTLAAHHLKSLYDQELMDMLISKGYFPEGYEVEDEEQFKEDLKRVDREAEAIQVKINLQKQRLPKKENERKITFDESVMGYAAFTGSGFIDPNTITVTQTLALYALGAEKMKVLENG